MPRQDVPYGGAICRLKERIAEIWDKLGEKLHSINGVEGDGAGNVEIVSGDAAITISESPTGHYIEIGLDHGNLPSAAVSSVNGQSGAVRLDAADILSDGDSNVQSDVDENKAAINALSGDIASEQTARQAADATLQTNINAVRASIPEMSTTPDPYKGVERDAQGRAFAADPASGAVDQSLVTANWASQTGAGAPNNLVHRSGTETVNGIKGFNALKFVGVMNNKVANTDYLLLRHSLASTTQNYRSVLLICKTNPVICQLIYLDYKITDDRIITLTNSRQTTLTDYNSTNTSTYSIYIENNQACIAIRTSQNQGVVCNVLANWVGSRFGVSSDVSEQGNTAVIPTQHAEVTI